jgi:hypothetical protein
MYTVSINFELPEDPLGWSVFQEGKPLMPPPNGGAIAILAEIP